MGLGTLSPSLADNIYEPIWPITWEEGGQVTCSPLLGITGPFSSLPEAEQSSRIGKGRLVGIVSHFPGNITPHVSDFHLLSTAGGECV